MVWHNNEGMKPICTCGAIVLQRFEESSALRETWKMRRRLCVIAVMKNVPSVVVLLGMAIGFGSQGMLKDEPSAER